MNYVYDPYRNITVRADEDDDQEPLDTDDGTDGDDQEAGKILPNGDK